MRVARKYLKRPGESQVFHVMSRFVDRRHVFDEEQKEIFHRVMRQLEEFSGCEVLTYCLMGNHFHILLRVPVGPREMGKEEVYRRMRAIYSGDEVENQRDKIEKLRKSGRDAEVELFFRRMRLRMYDVSSFVKDLKQRFTQAYNRNNVRKGTLWEERYQSVVISEEGRSLVVVAAYIDRNPYRAGLTRSGERYRWSGLGEAMSGGRRAQSGIGKIMDKFSGTGHLTSGLDDYRCLVMSKVPEVWEEEGVRAMGSARSVMARGHRELQMRSEGLEDWIQERCVHFSRGVVMGSGDFVSKFCGIPDMGSVQTYGQAETCGGFTFLRRRRHLDTDEIG